MTFFASPYHLAWFVISIVALALSLWLSRREKDPSLHFWFAVAHGIAVVEATWVVASFESNEVFSVHCIWFNGLMTIVHIVIERVKHNRR